MNDLFEKKETTERCLSVSQLNGLIKSKIVSAFPQDIWVSGEIQGYDRNRGKSHIFFELIEKEEGSKKILARIGLVIFSSRKGFIESVLKKNAQGLVLKDDIEVKFACRIDFYAPYGAVRLVVENIDPFFTLGKLAQDRQKLILMLKEKGVLDQNKTKELPLVPLNIGLITADDSAAYNDFLSELKQSGFGFQLYLRRTVMQGDRTERETCLAIDELVSIEGMDVVLITRGGGSIADLACFDSQKIAEKISNCSIPVLTGIGHDINITIADMAAHTSAKTPTAIAQFLVERVNDYLENLDVIGDDLLDCVQDIVGEKKQNLRQMAVDIQTHTQQFLKKYSHHLVSMEESLKRDPKIYLSEKNKKVERYEEELLAVLGRRFEKDKTRVKNIERVVDMVHPKNILKRGFSIMRSDKGSVVKHVKDIEKGQKFSVEILDGCIDGEVLNIKEG